MKKSLFILYILFQSVCSYAGHIAGGEVFYRYVKAGNAPNSSVYQISLRLFRECGANSPNTAAMPPNVNLNIYSNASPATQVGPQINVIRSSFQEIEMSPNPCISPPVSVCYQVGLYTLETELPNTTNGYIITFQTCCRTQGIQNIQTFPLPPNGTPNEGATYTGQIPGTASLLTGSNSSPVFALKDTTLVCVNSPFTLNFSATDPDITDSLSYSFCSAFDRGNTIDANTFNYSSPPYNPITYTNGFTGTTPLGASVTINPRTGIISGIAPGITGAYVVSVCITEWRNGSPISTHRKDFTLRVANCTITGAVLKPSYITCNGTTLTFENQSTSSNISSYAWDFGVPNLTNDISSNPTPTYDYLQSGKDSGTFTVKLKVTSTGGCQDSTTAEVKVYPGFNTDFNVQSTCILNPYEFKDATTTVYGVVDSWRWNFGDAASAADTARSKDSAWRYPSLQTVQVSLITTNSKGCVDTMTKSVTILDRPSLNLPFRDTLICSIDTLALRVNIGNGTVAWTPQIGPNQLRITNPNTTSPFVFPTDTTKYYVSVNDNGCANTDSVTVNVLQFISVDIRDTGVCLTDAFPLQPVSHALSYRWTSSTSGETVASTRNPIVRPMINTKYYVTANLGKCEAKDSMQVVVEPYPVATAGADQIICYGTRTVLNGTVTGTSFYWTPAGSLLNANTLTPTAGPTRTTTYILTATNTTGCLKPKTDTLVVTVIPMLNAYAGKDTAVLPGQPLQMQASGGTDYLWRPTTGLNNPGISNPIAIFDNTIDSITYTVRVSEGSCFADDQVTVRIFKNGVDIFVPSAFTPNADGKNDAVKPITIGITKLVYFSVYNRWGQLLFSTSEIGKAWDGRFGGIAQPPGTYVYQASGIDFLGNSVYRKGTIVLIR